MKINRIDIAAASAGTGKTYRLTHAILDQIKNGVDPASVLAITFTRKAANEIIERLRQVLLEDGRPDAAVAILDGYIGTVHSVCGRLIEEFAIEVGRSPIADVISEERSAAIFKVAIDAVIRRHSAAIEPLAARLDVEDWQATIQTICDFARQNDLSPDDLRRSARQSADSLAALLEKPPSDAAPLDHALAIAVDAALAGLTAALAADGKPVAATARAQELLKTVSGVLSNGRQIKWADWARLSKLDAGAKHRALVKPVLDAASMHPTHQRLHEDIDSFITAMFACAAEALDSYANHKKQQGLIDFTDQEQVAYHLMRRDDVRAALRERIKVVFVDEFQDTSPLQLALFLELAKIAETSLWVGDPKQAIYGFRGTDPELMGQTVETVIPLTKGDVSRLSKSYRSRPGLVGLANDLFGHAFPPTGIGKPDVLIDECARTDLPDQGKPVEIWNLEGTNWEDSLVALASGIAELLRSPDSCPIAVDGKHTRPLIGSDIAVLCRANNRCVEFAGALAQFGIKTAIGRPGLVETPEAVMAMAALRYLVDPRDTLAVAELAHFMHGAEGQPGWLETLLRTDGHAEIHRQLPALQALDAARTTLAKRTPTEALDLAIMAAGVAEQAQRWPHSSDRTKNLGALRGLAMAYEDECRATRSPATAAGLVGFVLENNESAEQPASGDPDAVRILTYHKAKGLEWPVVILLDLQAKVRTDPFGLIVEASPEKFDPLNPLAKRWIRYWPWPYGKQRNGTGLDQKVIGTRESELAIRRGNAEAVRLLYVGITRARDYLVLATRSKGTDWLDAMVDTTGNSVVELPNSSKPVFSIGGVPHPAKIVTLPVVAPKPRASGSQATYTIPTATVPVPVHPPRWRAPSREALPAGIELPRPATIEVGSRLALIGEPDMATVGNAIHGFLAIDASSETSAQRLALAEDQLRRWSVTALQPKDLVEAGDRLWKFLASAYPNANLSTECPLSGRVGLQQVAGWIDLLVETDQGFVVIDHKSYPGAPDKWAARANENTPQLALYARLVSEAINKPLVAALVHMPVLGVLLDVTEGITTLDAHR